jgi:2-keto-4-pentenoate hydratase/2-oxohepta-3-ene-1,7-dioic acid hydratase in catechol pathway
VLAGLQQKLQSEQGMSMQLNETHDPSLTSWVASANTPDTYFPIQNLPFCVFRPRGSAQAYRGGVAIGDQILDLAALGDALAEADDAARQAASLAARDSLNALMGAGQEAWSALRMALSRLLRSSATPRPELLVPQVDAEYAVPARIGDYTDFYTSIHHATSVGKLFRPDNPLLPNYKWVPIGYHGRSSTIGISGDSFRRPRGQFRAASDAEPSFGPSRRLDYELEMGIFVGGGNAQGEPIPVAEAEQHIFGLGISATRSLPVEEFRVHDLALDRNPGSAGALPRRLAARWRRPAAPALPRLRRTAQRGRPGHRAGSAAGNREHAPRRPAARAPVAIELPPLLLDRGPAAGPPHRERLRDARG